jgi:hypothetical protein
MAEVRPRRERPAIDTRLRLTIEEGLAAQLLVPTKASLEPCDGGSDGRRGRVDSGGSQQLQ